MAKIRCGKCEYVFTTNEKDTECPMCELPIKVNYSKKSIVDLNPAFESKLISISEDDDKS